WDSLRVFHSNGMLAKLYTEIRCDGYPAGPGFLILLTDRLCVRQVSLWKAQSFVCEATMFGIRVAATKTDAPATTTSKYKVIRKRNTSSSSSCRGKCGIQVDV